MSSYGLNAINSAGSVTASTGNHVPCLIASGANVSIPAGGLTVNYSNSNYRPLVFFNFSSTTSFATIELLSTTQLKIRIYQYVGAAVQPTAISGVLSYRVYAHPGWAASASAYGLVTYDGSGLKVQDTTLLQLKLSSSLQSINLSAGTYNLGDAFRVSTVTPQAFTWFLANPCAGGAGVSNVFGAHEWRVYWFMMRKSGSDFQMSSYCSSYTVPNQGSSSRNPYTPDNNAQNFFSGVPVGFI